MKLCLPNRRWPIGRDEPSFGTDLRLEQAVFGFEIFVIEPAIIAHPTGVNVMVLSWGLAIDHVLTSANDCVASRRATCADALRLFQEPVAHLAAESGRSRPD